MTIAFLFCAWVILYVYALYPLGVFMLSLFYDQLMRSRACHPPVSVVLSAYNEERHIERKILSLLAQAYPAGQIEILIGSDGSTDATDRIVMKYQEAGVKLFRQDERRGKPAMLNRLVRQAQGDILVFVDARQELEKNAVAELVSNFAVSEVGAVSGQLLFRKEERAGKAGEGVGLYWLYEKFIRFCEARTGSMLGATGAFYAIRRELYPALPEDIILDDVYIPVMIALSGHRSVYDGDAIIYDDVSAEAKDEFARKTRTLAGNFQLLRYCPRLFNPLGGKISWQFFSHKFLRLVVPYFLCGLFVTNMFLFDRSLFRAIFILQAVFYFLAVLGMVSKRPNRLTDIPAMFCVMNAAAVAGLYRFLTQQQDVKWERTRV